LAEVDGSTAGYIGNLRAAMPSVIPGAEGPLAELESAAKALDAAGVPYRVLSGTARNFEYYTGITFRFESAGRRVGGGGRYDQLSQTLGGSPAPACGWGADLLRLTGVAS
ncbi:MAG: ATP phosphoribosyltransferase regulatory subunit, partial [Chloroflexi bacterium]|nr:ATP phosphoribosyltransferase regulatory subunit [Chloroflexota bacterium]